MTEARLSFENAPRDVEKLMSHGRFSLRNLAYEIGLINKDDPAGVTAFDKLSLKGRADEVLAALLQIDKKKADSNAGADAEDRKKGAQPGRRQPVKPKDEPAETKVADKPPAAGAPALEQLLAAQAQVLEGLRSDIRTIKDQLRMVIRICKANMHMNGMVGEHIMQGDINEMIAEAFEGGKGIEPPGDEGN